MVFRVQGVLQEFREISPVKFRGVSHYIFTFTKSIKFVCGVKCLSSSHARTNRFLLELHAITVSMLLFESLYLDKIRRHFIIINKHNTEFKSFCNSYSLVRH
jgi:hypothetical protein